MTEFRQTDATAKDFRPISLDAINFLLADVRGALGPYLNVYLVTRQHWSLSEVGLVTTIGGLIGLALQTPAGALIDSTRAKRGLIVAALAVLATGAAVIALWPNFWPVLIANSLLAVVGDIFGPEQLLPSRSASLHGSSWRDAWGAIPPSTTPATLPSRRSPASSDGSCRSARSSSSCRSFPCLPRSPSCPFRRRPSTMTGRGASRRRARRTARVRRTGRCSWNTGHFSYLPAVRCCSISPTRRSCRSSARSSPFSIRRSRRP